MVLPTKPCLMVITVISKQARKIYVCKLLIHQRVPVHCREVLVLLGHLLASLLPRLIDTNWTQWYSHFNKKETYMQRAWAPTFNKIRSTIIKAVCKTTWVWWIAWLNKNRHTIQITLCKRIVIGVRRATKV